MTQGVRSCRNGLVAFCLMLFCMASCRTTTKPQQPTYHNGSTLKVDSSLLDAIRLNQHLAEEADIQLSHFAALGYAQQESGYWSKGLREEEHTLCENDKVMLHQVVFLMDSTLVEDSYTQVTVGKSELLPVIAEVLQKMTPASHVSLILPWYLAFGATGNEHIEPYSNIRVELTTDTSQP